MVEPIPENTTKISTNTSTSSNTNLIKIFEENICELKTTTREKFIKFISSESEEFILAVIKYQASINTKSWVGFNKAIENFKNNNIHISEALKVFIEEYHNSKNNKKIIEERESVNITNNIIDEMTYYDEIKEFELDIIDFIKDYLKNEIEELKFLTWIESIEILEKDGIIVIKIIESFHMNHIEENYMNLIKLALIKNKVNGRIKLLAYHTLNFIL